jgi:hypothetical protein
LYASDETDPTAKVGVPPDPVPQLDPVLLMTPELLICKHAIPEDVAAPVSVNEAV